MKIDRQLLMTGIPLIDKQHEEYANLVDQLFGLITRKKVTREALSKEIDAVIKYAVEHFDAEEFLMRSQKYPAYAEHLAKHNIFRDKMDSLPLDMQEDISLDEYAITLNKWLIQWFYDQVQIDDRKLAVFLKRATKDQPKS
jgi:hemerythrin